MAKRHRALTPKQIEQRLQQGRGIGWVKDPLESQEDGTEQLVSSSSPSPEETASVPDEQETSSSESVNESQPNAKKEQTQMDSQLTDELPHQPLTQAEVAKRLGVKSSTLASAKKRPNFPEWSKSKDPEGIAWQWVPEYNRFVRFERVIKDR